MTIMISENVIVYLPLTITLLLGVDDNPFEAVHQYKSMSFFPDITSVVPKKLSLPILCAVPTACMLSRTEVKPPGPVTFMLRALPPLEVHTTLNFLCLCDTTSILADTDCTGGEIKS